MLVFYPETISQVQNIVQFCIDNQLRIRVSGYRHSFGPVFAESGHVLISMLPEHTASTLPHKELPNPSPEELPNDSLLKVRVQDNSLDRYDPHFLVTVGPSVTNYHLVNLCKRYGMILPFNVVMTEISLGGSNAGICHGAGAQWKTLSDLVTSITWVNNQAKCQTVNATEPDLLRAAAGALGLLGPVVEITLKLLPLRYAVLKPRKVRSPQAVPPPVDFTVPRRWPQPPKNKIETDNEIFEKLVRDSWYCEFFWFPFQKDSWVNCWEANGTAQDAKEYPPRIIRDMQRSFIYITNTFQKWIKNFLPKFQAESFGRLAMFALPSGVEVTAPIHDALHFQHGIQNMPVWNFELEIPLPPKADKPNEPNLEIARRAWWECIKAVEEDPDIPMRITLEMRIMGGSDIYLAPQKGNKWTCSIEVLTKNTPQKVWYKFIQKLLDKWSSIPGVERVHPHWSKEWDITPPLTINGKNIRTYLLEKYGEEINQFKGAMQRLAQKVGIQASDNRIFSNPTWDKIFYPPQDNNNNNS